MMTMTKNDNNNRTTVTSVLKFLAKEWEDLKKMKEEASENKTSATAAIDITVNVGDVGDAGTEDGNIGEQYDEEVV